MAKNEAEQDLAQVRGRGPAAGLQREWAGKCKLQAGLCHRFAKGYLH